MPKPVKTNVEPNVKTDIKVDEKVDEVVSEEEEKALIEAQQLEQKLEALKARVNDLKQMLSNLQPNIDIIYTKYQNKDTNTTLQDLEENDLNELSNYINTYKEYVTTLSEIDAAENEKEGGLFDSYIVEPISNAFGNMFDKAKNAIAKLATGSGKFWTDTIARSMEEMEPSLKRIQEAKARIYGTATQGLEDATKSVDASTQSLSQDIEGSTQDLNNAKVIMPDLSTGVQSPVLVSSRGGGRYSNIKEVQKGGAAAAKRVENSIKQFLSSSVTSSHILSMVKRKSKAKRKGNGKRYSRKRAKK